MNLVILMGNTTHDIETKQTANGLLVANFQLAVRNIYNKDKTDFIRCVAFAKTAEILRDYVKKGQKISVEGRLEVSEYQTPEGENKKNTQVIVSLVHLISSPNQTAKEVTPQDFQEEAEEELPF